MGALLQHRSQMIEVLLDGETDFAGWRDAARRLALSDVPPEAVTWSTGRNGDLFGSREPLPDVPSGVTMNVPRAFVDLAELVICHSDPQRFALLYRILYRLRSEPDLIKIASDGDIIRLNETAKSVRRDIHKMRAFVRFRQIVEESSSAMRPSSCAASPACAGRS
jgi:DNA polymerase